MSPKSKEPPTPMVTVVPLATFANGLALQNVKQQLGDYFHDEQGRLRKHKGLGWMLASLFVIADMAGGGIVALPTAVVRCRLFLFYFIQYYLGIRFII